MDKGLTQKFEDIFTAAQEQWENQRGVMQSWQAYAASAEAPLSQDEKDCLGKAERGMKQAALRAVLAGVILHGRETRVGNVGIADCFNPVSGKAAPAPGMLIAKVFPEVAHSSLDLMDVEARLEAEGVHCKARKIRSLIVKKG